MQYKSAQVLHLIEIYTIPLYIICLLYLLTKWFQFKAFFIKYSFHNKDMKFQSKSGNVADHNSLSPLLLQKERNIKMRRGKKTTLLKLDPAINSQRLPRDPTDKLTLTFMRAEAFVVCIYIDKYTSLLPPIQPCSGGDRS